jgi:hypothetical protein
MLNEKFIFKIHRNGQVKRVKDCNNITVLDIINEIGISKQDIECKPIKNSEIYAFYGNESDVLILGVLEHQLDNQQMHENDVVGGILGSQFSILSSVQETLS